MAGPRIISVVGHKNAGKTTLMVAMAAEFVRRGRRVMTLKHGHHPADADRPGSDTWRHLHEGKAERVAIMGPEIRVIYERQPDDYDPLTFIRRHMSDADVVLIEGFKRAPLPKIEVFRRAVAPAPLLRANGATPGEWIAVLTDDLNLQAPCRVLHFTDTMWLQFLANLAWDRGLVLDH
ncbi:MAG: molybdopterin-guanine dinucleotide biosynthesis protein B [Gemmatimonadota bacterium]